MCLFLNSCEDWNQPLPVDTRPTQTFTSTSSLLLPPSYSLAIGLDLHEEEVKETREDGQRRRRRGEAESGFRKWLLTPRETNDFLFDSASTSCPLTSRTQELTASELLRNRWGQVSQRSVAWHLLQLSTLSVCVSGLSMMTSWRHQTVSMETSLSCSSCATPLYNILAAR